MSSEASTVKGSEGKGAIAAYLSAKKRMGDNMIHVVRVAGPNAGHSVMDETGHKWKLQHVPVAAVTNPDAQLYLGPGSEVNISILQREVAMLDEAGFNVSGRIFVDAQASVLTEEYSVLEHGGRGPHGADGLTKSIGSTGEGVGACRAARMMRAAELYGGSLNVPAILEDALDHDETVLIEGTQGYALGLHAGYYPQCTTSDCRAVDFCAMAGLSPWSPLVRSFEAWVVLRSHPIRVAGNSGPMKLETSWEALGIPEEHTTVTKKTRRVGGWDAQLAVAALRANGADGRFGKDSVRVAFTFYDYIQKDAAGMTDPDAFIRSPSYNWLRNCEDEIGHRIALVGTGPDSIIDLRSRLAQC